MPSEVRQIVFCNEELREAVILYNETSKKKLPDGIIQDCRVQSGDEISVIANIEPFESSTATPIKLGAAYLGAVLINYCIRKNIPLARHSEKSLQTLGDNIVLQVTMGMSHDKILDALKE